MLIFFLNMAETTRTLSIIHFSLLHTVTMKPLIVLKPLTVRLWSSFFFNEITVIIVSKSARCLRVAAATARFVNSVSMRVTGAAWLLAICVLDILELLVVAYTLRRLNIANVFLHFSFEFVFVLFVFLTNLKKHSQYTKSICFFSFSNTHTRTHR